MTIKLIDEQERRVFRYPTDLAPGDEDASITYHRIDAREKSALLRRHTALRNGREQIDSAAFLRDLLQRTVVDWSGFVGAEGAPTPFSIDALLRVPEKVLTDLIEHMNEVTVEDDDGAHRKN